MTIKIGFIRAIGIIIHELYVGIVTLNSLINTDDRVLQSRIDNEVLLNSKIRL